MQKQLVNGRYGLLDLSDIEKADVGGGTNFNTAFEVAEKYIKNKSKFPKKRILFLTDGISSSSQLQSICNRMIQENLQINIVGFGYEIFEHLRQFASSPECFKTSNNFEDVKEFSINVFVAE